MYGDTFPGFLSGLCAPCTQKPIQNGAQSACKSSFFFLRLVYEVFMKTYDTSSNFVLIAVLGPLRFKRLNVILSDIER